ncbi:MAG: glycine zipper 2TM domain-containing protein [Gammaproteobacteria bacterium]|nr:glycine zipper 2TM domain-containing protein [Gammaproteobacteria bacterium]
MRSKSLILPGALILQGVVLLIAGCARHSASSQVYPRYETRTAYDVEYGEVVGVRQVEIEGYSTFIGTWGGAVVGDAIGSTVDGRNSRRVARAVGGVAGAVIGEAIEREVTSEVGLEITVLLDSGGTIAVVQAADIPFAPGDEARILFGPEGSARVTQR